MRSTTSLARSAPELFRTVNSSFPVCVKHRSGLPAVKVSDLHFGNFSWPAPNTCATKEGESARLVSESSSAADWSQSLPNGF